MKNPMLPTLILSVMAITAGALGIYLENDWATLMGLCALLGIIVKSTDQLIDVEEAKRKRDIMLLAATIPIIMGYLAFRYDPVFGMVVGTGLGLLLMGKLDHPGYYLSFFGFLAVVFLVATLMDMGFSRETYLLIPMALAGSFSDEFIHERTARQKDWVHGFFDHRPLLKVVAVLATVIGFADPVHLAGFLMFDLLYDVVAVLWGE